MRLRRSGPDVSVFTDIALFDGYGRRRLAPLARHVDRLVVAPGARLAEAGRRPHEVVLILEGEALVRRAGVEVGRLGAGAAIGAAEEADGTPHDADMVAETAVSALLITGQAFRWALRMLPAFTDRLAPRDRPSATRTFLQPTAQPTAQPAAQSTGRPSASAA